MSELMLEIGKLTLRDRLALVQEILATIAAEAEPTAGLELSESEILELNRRSDEVESGSVPTVSWTSVKEKLAARYGTNN